jgi:hypothetical protein
MRGFFQLDGEVHGIAMPYAESGGMLEDLRPRACEEQYRALTQRFAVDTHRNALA